MRRIVFAISVLIAVVVWLLSARLDSATNIGNAACVNVPSEQHQACVEKWKNATTDNMQKLTDCLTANESSDLTACDKFR